MIYVRSGSQVHRLITLLSVVGDFPIQSLGLLGNERVYKVLVNKLNTKQDFQNPDTGEKISCRLLNVCGKGKWKSVRFFKGGIPILRWIGAEEYYLNAFAGHDIPGDQDHRDRFHRVGEAVAMCMNADIEIRAYLLPQLLQTGYSKNIPDEPSLYMAKDIKRIGQTELNKTCFSRMVGAIFAGRQCLAVYNTRDAAMKWSGLGEFKTQQNLKSIAGANAQINAVDSAVLLAESDSVALETLLEIGKNRRKDNRFDSIFRHIHAVPMNDYGVRLLRLFCVSDWKEKILDYLFDPSERSYNHGDFEYDAFIDGIYVYSFLDCDIARLQRFRSALSHQTGLTVEILCYPQQTSLLQAYIGRLASVKVIELAQIEEELGVKRRNLYDR